MTGSALIAEIVDGETLTHVTFTPGEDGSATALGSQGSERIGFVEIPSIIAALFDLHPTGFVDQRFSVTPGELDAFVNDGAARMLVLTEEGATAAEAIVFDHRDLGYFIVEPTDDPERIDAATVRSLDVWTVICSIAAEVCGA